MTNARTHDEGFSVTVPERSRHRLLAVVALLAACGDDASSSADAALADAPSAPTAAELLTVIASCTVIGGKYQPDDGVAATIDVCGTNGAVFWTADLDVDCNGKASAKCSLQTDPAYQPLTAAMDSNGEPLDAATLPYVVLPPPSMRFDYRSQELAMGSVVAVIYQDRVEYGVAGDTGAPAVIGAASYRMAELLGIDPAPTTGGAPSGVAYIAFTGAGARVDVMEDHAEAVRVGVAHARTLLGSP